MRVTISLILINIIFFILQQQIFWFTETFSLTPLMAFSGYYWQFFTYMFLHASPQHLFFNMFGLFIFGIVVEKELGWKKYLFIYIVSGLGSAFLYIIFEGLKSTVLMLGASGAVFGVLTAYAFKFPKNWVIVFPGIPMPAALLVVFYIILEFVLGIFNLEPGIANFSHLGGIITSLIIMFYFRHKEERDIMLSDW